MAKGKKFRFVDVFLSVLCVVFTVDAAAPAAAIGNSQFFWWILLIFTFLLPYGFVVAELGTTYDSAGGLYDWVRNAFGDRWAARVAWCYWLNYPIWIASMAVLVPASITVFTGIELGTVPTVLIELAFIWFTMWLADAKVSDSAWLMNGIAVLKVGIALAVGALGLWYAIHHGFAEPFTYHSLLPDFTDTRSLSYLSIILFNFMGFEVVTTFADDMANPDRDMPLAIIMGGLTIAAIYLFSSFGIGVGIPVEKISLDTGIVDAVTLMAGEGSPIVSIVALAFVVTLFGNGVSWSFGVNSAAFYAARHGNMPRWFGIESKKTGMAVGSAVTDGIVASILVLLQQFLAGDVFWALFSMQLVFEMLSYVPMFPAFLRLRTIDPTARRPFRCPGGSKALRVISWLPAIEIVLAIVATVVPLGTSGEELAKIPTLVGVVVFVLLGEVVRILSARGRAHEYRGITAQEIAHRDSDEATT